MGNFMKIDFIRKSVTDVNGVPTKIADFVQRS